MWKLALSTALAFAATGCGGLTESSRQEPPEVAPPLLEPVAFCPPRSLAVPWEVLPGCWVPKVAHLPERSDFMPLRCAFSRSLNQPEAAPFIGCCPRALPFGCANGTPMSCYATALEAGTACADECQQCSEFSPLDSP